MALVSDIDRPDQPWEIGECEQILARHAQHLKGEAAARWVNSLFAMLSNVAVQAGMAKGKYEGRALSPQYYDWLQIREGIEAAHDAYLNEMVPDDEDDDEGDEDADERRENSGQWPPLGVQRGYEDGKAHIELQAERGKQELPRDWQDAAVDAVTGIMQYVWVEGVDPEDTIRVATGHYEYERDASDEQAEGEGFAPG